MALNVLGLGGPQLGVASVFQAGSLTPIEVGTAITGTIEGGSEVDAYSFPAQQGGLYVIETGIPASRALEDSLLALWDTNGTTVMEVNDDYGGSLASRIEWTAPLSGTYYLTVENVDWISTGGYTVVVRPAGR